MAVLSLCCAFLICVLTIRSSRAERTRMVSAAEVDQSVIAALLQKGVTKPKVISHIDLTEPFGTLTQWTFLTVQTGGQPIAPNEDHGPILICLVKAAIPECDEHFYRQAGSEQPTSDTPYHLLASSVVYASQNKSNPLLLVKVCTAEIFDGNCGLATSLYTYEKRTDRFIRVFLNVTGRNNNEATRFVEHGPLLGDVIADYPTENAPYTYWIEVYRAGKSGQYARILRYRGHTGYGDGNQLAVADSEMPEILLHLKLWRPGDALPVPAQMPNGCSDLFMRHNEEWCK